MSTVAIDQIPTRQYKAIREPTPTFQNIFTEYRLTKRIRQNENHEIWHIICLRSKPDSLE